MNRKLWENLLSLLSVHTLNYLAPLLTLPVLARVLGPGNWGKLAFADAYANYVALLIEYGFNLSATREVAKASEDKQLHSRLLTNVLSAQLLIAVACAAATVLLVFLVPSMRPYAAFLPLALVMATFRALTPLWYFQGLERLRLVAGINIVVNLLSAVIVISIVHSSNQIMVPLEVRAVAASIAAFAAYAVAYRSVHFTLPSMYQAWLALKDGWSIFLFRSAVGLYTSGNVLLIGLLAPASAIAWFAGAERIIRAGSSAFGPISQTFYPRIVNLLTTNPAEARRTARASLKFTVGVGIAGGLVIFLGAPLLVKILLGDGYLPSIPVLRCMSLLPPAIATSTVLGIQWMLPLRLDSTYTKIILSAGILNVFLAVILAPLYRQMGMAFSVTAAEVFVTIAVIVVLRRKGLHPWAVETSIPLAESVAC